MTRAEILDAAKACVCGEREQDYGTPENNFTLISKLWEAYTGHSYSAKDVGVMMALLKIARIKGGSKDDNFVDLAGYAACAGELAAEPLPAPAPMTQLAADKDGICPVCGEAYDIDGEDSVNGECGYWEWTCPHCGATGRAGYNKIFGQHYHVEDAYGNPIPGRPELR